MTSAPTLEVQSLINECPMNPRRWGVVALCFVIALLDGFDTQSIAFIGPAIAEEFGMQAADMTWVITASTVGMAIGAMSLGSLGTAKPVAEARIRRRFRSSPDASSSSAQWQISAVAMLGPVACEP